MCARHVKQVGTQGWLGKVTGEIPEEALRVFEREEVKRLSGRRQSVPEDAAGEAVEVGAAMRRRGEALREVNGRSRQ